MEQPEGMEGRIEKKIEITLQSFNFAKLIAVQQEIMNFIESQRNIQDSVEPEDYVWVATLLGVE